ncbi:MAG TPA: DDE-type integrase/transposase/recombinase [Gemmatimonadales bacterium]|nr:DDE-type integrase/transposase/recombinase [Gemmatimonadales bacterium]
MAVSAATWGASRIAAYLRHRWQLRVAPSTVQRALRRTGLATRRQRLTVLEHRALQTAGLLTERTRRLWQAQHGQPRHVAAREPGELVCLDTFYIGQLKGVGKVWQITACDAACSYGVAWLLPAHTAEAAAHFLRRILLPLYRRAGWRLRRVLTDGGPEFKGAFDEACHALGLRHTRTKPRHAWTNGFVERLQGTILQEHWRVAFRRPLLHQPDGLAAQPRGLHAVLQPRTAASRLSRPRPHPRRALLGRRAGMTSYRTLGWPRCLHHCESGQPRALMILKTRWSLMRS